MTSGGEGPLGYKHSDESRLKIGLANKKRIGKPGHVPDEQTRNRLSDALKRRWQRESNPMLGRHHSEASKEKMRQSHLGQSRPLSEEHKEKIREAFRRKHVAASIQDS